MRQQDIQKWLEHGLSQRGKTQTALAEHLGVLPSAVNRMIRGERKMLAHEMYAAADYLEQPLPGQAIPIVGKVGGGAVIYPHDDHAMGAGLDDADPPPVPVNPSTVAVIVEGDSMAGDNAPDGSVLYYDERHAPDASLIGRLCIIWCADGRMLVKRLEYGSQPGLWSLRSSNGTTERDVAITHVARVRFIQPR
jgi:transcriptional regulator with XRE-family HTH domain